VKKNDDLNAQI